jgi:hypothetical protein
MIVAQFDSSLSATVVTTRALHYSAGPDPAQDRPGHVRAGSGIARVGDALAIIQDDANFIAVVRGDHVGAVPLPPGPGGARQFGEALGNKAHKLDLEACILHQNALIAFGSGSTPARRRVVIVRDLLGASPDVRVVDASSLYARLGAEESFAGSELNIEGAAALGDRLTLFQRGNGAARGRLTPRNATCALPMNEVWKYLTAGGPCPRPADIESYALGEIDGVRLTFTDATATACGRIVFLAAAEDSPDTYSDGRVVGVAVGIIAGGSARLTRLTSATGAPVLAKTEGIALRGDDASMADVVVDKDDADAPCELYSVRMSGFF